MLEERYIARDMLSQINCDLRQEGRAQSSHSQTKTWQREPHRKSIPQPPVFCAKLGSPLNLGERPRARSVSDKMWRSKDQNQRRKVPRTASIPLKCCFQLSQCILDTQGRSATALKTHAFSLRLEYKYTSSTKSERTCHPAELY